MDVPNEDWDLLGRIKTDQLYQPFLELLNELLNRCAARGAIYVATSGNRTYKEQDKLYSYGRTDLSKKKVTNAKGGQSYHNMAIAVDLCPHIGGPYKGKLNPDYSEKNYKVLEEECHRLGLEWGGDWVSIKDLPHVQLPLSKQGIKLKDLDKLYRSGGYPAVFKHLDTFDWS